VHDYLQPIIDAYAEDAYSSMEHAVFPSFFHGKCQDPKTGIMPPGCPNPDCHVVCGTPGSLVHFYPILREIAFNTTRDRLVKLSTPGSPAYARVQRLVLSDALRLVPHSPTYYETSAKRKYPPQFGPGPRTLPGNSQASIVQNLQTVLSEVGPLLGRACGEDGDTPPYHSSFKKCSWEKRMKEYILTFP
jgi:hypothetical protein